MRRSVNPWRGFACAMKKKIREKGKERVSVSIFHSESELRNVRTVPHNAHQLPTHDRVGPICTDTECKIGLDVAPSMLLRIFVSESERPTVKVGEDEFVLEEDLDGRVMEDFFK